MNENGAYNEILTTRTPFKKSLNSMENWPLLPFRCILDKKLRLRMSSLEFNIKNLVSGTEYMTENKIHNI